MANPRFIDNGDGTFTLPALGLMFTKATVTPECVTHTQAEAACAELRTAGHDDWRLPTRAELLTLVDDTLHQPAINVDAFPDTKSDWYWTSTVSAWSSARAWCVHFDNGDCGLGYRDLSFGLVRAVRSVPAGYALVPRGMFEAEMRRREVGADWDQASPMIKKGWYEVANDAIDAMGEP